MGKYSAHGVDTRTNDYATRAGKFILRCQISAIYSKRALFLTMIVVM